MTSRGIFYFAAQPGQPFALRVVDFSWRIVYDTFLDTDGSMTMLQLRRRPN